MSQIDSNIVSLINFKQKLNDLGHFYTVYADINDLKFQFNNQLTKLLPELTSSFLNIAGNPNFTGINIEGSCEDISTKNSNNSKLQNLQNQKEQLEEQIADLENLNNKFRQELKDEGDADQRIKLRSKIKKYSAEIGYLYNNIDRIEANINKIKLNNKNLSSNNSENSPDKRQQLKIDESLRYIDFKKALETFEKIQSQFDKDGDVALFLMEESLIKRGDLYLQRLRDNLKSNTNSFNRQNFRYCPVTYTPGNSKAFLQGLASFFNVKNVEAIDGLIQQIGKSLQNDSVLFIEINCDINNEGEIDTLIPWFINDFWQPLQSKVNEVTKDYEGIRVVAVIVSNFNINQRLLTNDLSCYCNDNHESFARDKLVKIPLDNWTQDDIFNWLKDINRSLTKSQRNDIASKIYNTTQGLPNTVCFALRQQWQILINSATSC